MRFSDCRYPNDVRRIVALSALQADAPLSVEQAQDAWEAYSDRSAASWLALPEDDEDLWAIIQPACA